MNTLTLSLTSNHDFWVWILLDALFRVLPSILLVYVRKSLLQATLKIFFTDFLLVTLLKHELFCSSLQGFCLDFQNSYFSENLFCGWSTLIDFDLLKELLKLKTKQKNYNYKNDDIEIITISIIVVIIILIILIW